MLEFAKYYMEFIRNLGANLWNFISGVFNAFANIFVLDNIGYVTYFFDQTIYFNAFDWIIAIIVIFLLILHSLVFCLLGSINY